MLCPYLKDCLMEKREICYQNPEGCMIYLKKKVLEDGKTLEAPKSIETRITFPKNEFKVS